MSESSPALTDLLVGPGGQALAAQCHAVALPRDVPHMGVHRHRLRLVQGQQADTVGHLPPAASSQPPVLVSAPCLHPHPGTHLGTYTRQGTQHPPGLGIGLGAELAQPLGAEPLGDGPCTPADELGPVPKAQRPQPGLGISACRGTTEGREWVQARPWQDDSGSNGVLVDL